MGAALIVLADERNRHIAPSTFDDLVEGEGLGAANPSPAGCPGYLPARFVEVNLFAGLDFLLDCLLRWQQGYRSLFALSWGCSRPWKTKRKSSHVAQTTPRASFI